MYLTEIFQKSEITAFAKEQMEIAERAKAEDTEIDNYARENIKDYSSLSEPNQGMIRKIIREGRAKEIENGTLLTAARVSARSGLNIVFGSEMSKKSSNDERYALRENVEVDVERALNDISYREDIPLTNNSPSIIASQKGVRNLPMLMKASHIRENIFTEQEAKGKGLKIDKYTNYHGLGKDLFLKIIGGLDNVTQAYRGTKNADNSSRRENYFLLISQYKDSNGNTVNVPVYVDKQGQYNRVMIETNKIATVFGRNNFNDYINREIQKGNLVKIKNRSTQDSERTAPIAGGFVKNASSSSISQSAEKINTSDENNSASRKALSEKSGGADAKLSGNTIYIDPKASKERMRTKLLLHEAGHAIFRNKKWTKTFDKLLRQVSPERYKEIAQRYSEMYQAKNIKFSAYQPIVQEEIAMHYIEDVLGNMNAWDYILAEDMSVKDKFLAFLGKSATDYSEDAKLSGTAKKLLRTYKKMFSELSARNSQSNAYGDSLSRINSEKMHDNGTFNSDNRQKSANLGVSTERHALNNDTQNITLQNIETLRDILKVHNISGNERLSINQFTSDDIKKSEPWARKFFAELGTKSPFFRAWFGDWRAYDTSSLQKTVSKDNKKLVNGRATNQDTGKVMSWNAHDITSETTNHTARDKISVEAINQLDNIIENAVLLDTVISAPTSKSKMRNTAFMHSFYAIYENSNGQYLLKLYVEEALSNNEKTVFTRAYQLKDIQKVADLPNGVSESKPSLSDDKSATTYSISDLFEFVKQFDKDFKPKPVNEVFLNEDGTPKVFYHGTGEQFTVFDPAEMRDREGSFFFAENRQDAEGYGSNVYEVYLQADNLANYDDQPLEFYQLRNKRKQVEWLKERGYDGWYSDMDSGGWGEVSVFKNTQIKSATDNIGTFDGGNADIRYALHEDEDISGSDILDNLTPDWREELKSNLKENQSESKPPKAAPKVRNKTGDTVKQRQTALEKNGNRKSFSRKEIRELTKRLKGAEGLSPSVRDEMSDAIWRILNEAESESERRELTHGMAEYIVDRVLSDSVTENPDSVEAQDKLAYIKTGIGKLVFTPDEIAELQHKYDEKGLKSIRARWGYKGARRTQGSDIVSARRVSLDEFVTSIAREMPGMAYLEDMNYLDAFFEINELYEELRLEADDTTIPRYWDMPDSEIPNMIADIESSIIEAYHNGGTTVAKKLIGNRLDAAVRKAEFWRSEHRKLQNAKDKRYAKYREARERTQNKKALYRAVNRLNSRLFNPKKNKNIHYTMQPFVAEALSKLNYEPETMKQLISVEEAIEKLYRADVPDTEKIAKLESKRDKLADKTLKLAESMRALAEAYGKFAEAGGVAKNAFDADVAESLADMIKTVGDTPVSKLTAEQMAVASRFYEMLLHRINTANEFYRAEQNQTVSDMAESIIGEVKDAKTIGMFAPNVVSVKFANSAKRFLINNMKPPHLFESLRSGTLLEAYEGLHRGELIWGRDIDEAKAFFDKCAEKYKFYSWDQKSRMSFVSNNGKDFSLTLGQRMSLYAYLKRKNSHSHLSEGGFKFAPDTPIEDGLIKRYLNDATQYKLKEDVLNKIAESLTDEQRRFVDEMQGYLSNELAAKGNEVSRVLYGIDLFTEKNYFPMKCAGEYLDSQTGKQGDPKIKNKGMAKPVEPHAENPLILGDFLDIWSRHVNDMAQYHGMVLPTENMNRLLGYVPKISSEIKIENDVELEKRIKKTEKSKYTVIAEYLMELFGGQKFDLSDGKKAIVDRRDANKLTSKADDARIAQLVNLKKVVENAIYSHSENKVVHNKFSDFHYYAVDVIYAGETYKLWINVGVAKNNGENHIYSITKRNEEAPTDKGVVRPVGNALQNASSDNSIHQNQQNVNDLVKKTSIGSSLKQVMQEKYGLDVISYIEQLLIDINGGVRGYNSLGGLDALLANFKKVSTMASFSVAIQQPSSLPRAMAYIDSKYFAHLPKLKDTSGRWAEIKKHAPIAILKEMGGYDTGTGKNNKIKKPETPCRSRQFKLFLMVPVVGVEPTRYCYLRILSPTRLPIPPYRHGVA